MSSGLLVAGVFAPNTERAARIIAASSCPPLVNTAPAITCSRPDCSAVPIVVVVVAGAESILFLRPSDRTCLLGRPLNEDVASELPDSRLAEVEVGAEGGCMLVAERKEISHMR